MNTRWRECAGCHRQSARVPGSDGATGRATSVPWVSAHTRCLHTCWRGAGRRGLFCDHREAAAGVCPWPRTVCESAGERWRDAAGHFRTLGIRSHPMLAHMLARGGSARPVFSTTEKRRRECARGRAQSALVPGRDGATGRATSVPWVSGHTDACTHVGVQSNLVDYTEIRLSRNDDGAVPVAAHSLRECRGAIMRRRMLFAYLGCPVTPMHVCGGGRDAIFGFRQTVIGRRNSHLETLRRTQEVLNCPQHTVLQAYT